MFSKLPGQYVGSLNHPDTVMVDGKIRKAFLQVDILNNSPLYGRKVIPVKFPSGFKIAYKEGEMVEIPVESSGWGNDKKAGQSVVYAPVNGG
jgi:hypothetical protein